nr:RNA-directed DNA polymerase, eukaryota, reverse transcriptase zinc-binding domain protein [Tanacetum cinerariifolium]
MYKNDKGEVQCKKNVKVLYDWKPPLCNDCGVFGHADRKDVGIDNKVKMQNYKANHQPIKFGNNIKTMYQAKNKNQVVKEKTLVKNPKKSTKKNASNDNANDEGKSESNKKKWSVYKDILEAMKRPANKFSVFKMYDKRELLVDKGKNNGEKKKGNEEEEDVLEEMNRIAKSMERNDLKGCRIMVRWNNDEVRIFVIHMARQSMSVKMETNNGSIKMYGTFIFASNGFLERKELWKDLEIYRSIIGNEPCEAMKDNDLILYQKAKVKWLSVGDRNSAYFHRTIKSKQQRNRIDDVCDENGNIFEGELFKGYDRKIGPKRVALKVDIQKELFKGYDRKMGPKRVALKVDIQKDLC